MSKNTRKMALASVERSMVAIRRSQTRRALSQLLERASGDRVKISHSLVVDALDRKGEPNPPTVGEVAVRLGVDPSRASRMVADAVTAGYVRRVALQVDGRSVGLELTDKGRVLAETARRVRTAVFRQAMRDWPEKECETFARLLARFIEKFGHIADV